MKFLFAHLINHSTFFHFFCLVASCPLHRQPPPTPQVPFILMPPKSLLPLPQASSRLDELAGGRWYPVLDDPWAAEHAGDIRRVVLCSGKVYYDLLTEAEKLTADRP